MKTKERGYFKLDTPDGVKWAHFSRTFITQLQKHTGKDLVTWGQEINKTDDTLTQFDAITDVLYAGMISFCLEEDLEQDFNLYKVGNWLWDSMNEDDNVASEIFETLQAALPKAKEVKGK